MLPSCTLLSTHAHRTHLTYAYLARFSCSTSAQRGLSRRRGTLLLTYRVARLCVHRRSCRIGSLGLFPAHVLSGTSAHPRTPRCPQQRLGKLGAGLLRSNGAQLSMAERAVANMGMWCRRGLGSVADYNHVPTQVAKPLGFPCWVHGDFENRGCIVSPVLVSQLRVVAC